ncbi:MAG TPA: hypothetical protein VMR14_18255 [Streptosporangiaceae bacterium]|nr:hypothetical protein [Streptosporangiaceae bacterium]
MAITVVRYSEQPGLWDGLAGLTAEVWPEYNLHGDRVNAYWERLYDEFAAWQFALYDTDEQLVLCEGNTIPVSWDGIDTGLGPGIDATIAGGFALAEAGGTPTALCALAAKIPSRHRNRRLSGVILEGMAGLARQAGLPHLIAPVRPNLKERYPTIPIERYSRWTRADGSAFDPWLRVHLRLGARLGPAIPESLRITGSVADWESWTSMEFPETGDYVFPAGLDLLHIDRQADTGSYWEPNVWVIHTI